MGPFYFGAAINSATQNIQVPVFVWVYVFISLDFARIAESIGSSRVKNLPANIEEAGLILGSGRSPGEGNILAWEIPWMEKPGRIQSMGLQKLDMI